jgi:hypothetical protein
MNIFTAVNVLLAYLLGLLRIFPEYLLFAATSYLVVGVVWAVAKGVRPPKPGESSPDDSAETPPTEEPEPVSGP